MMGDENQDLSFQREVVGAGVITHPESGVRYRRLWDLWPLGVHHLAMDMTRAMKWVGPPAVVLESGKDDGEVFVLAGADSITAACVAGVDAEVVSVDALCKDIAGDMRLALGAHGLVNADTWSATCEVLKLYRESEAAKQLSDAFMALERGSTLQIGGWCFPKGQSKYLVEMADELKCLLGAAWPSSPEVLKTRSKEWVHNQKPESPTKPEYFVRDVPGFLYGADVKVMKCAPGSPLVSADVSDVDVGGVFLVLPREKGWVKAKAFGSDAMSKCAARAAQLLDDAKPVRYGVEVFFSKRADPEGARAESLLSAVGDDSTQALNGCWLCSDGGGPEFHEREVVLSPMREHAALFDDAKEAAKAVWSLQQDKNFKGATFHINAFRGEDVQPLTDIEMSDALDLPQYFVDVREAPFEHGMYITEQGAARVHAFALTPALPLGSGGFDSLARAEYYAKGAVSAVEDIMGERGASDGCLSLRAQRERKLDPKVDMVFRKALVYERRGDYELRDGNMKTVSEFSWSEPEPIGDGDYALCRVVKNDAPERGRGSDGMEF